MYGCGGMLRSRTGENKVGGVEQEASSMDNAYVGRVHGRARHRNENEHSVKSDERM